MRRLITRAAAAALLAMAGAASNAQTIGMHTLSWHDQPGYHSSTPGLYVRTNTGLTVGAMQNSEGHAGAYAGYTASTDEQRRLSAAITVGLITGYTLAPVLPMAVPSIALKLSDQAAVRVLVLPRFHPKQGANALSLTLEWRLP